jgi:hypothetical protein
MNEAQHQTLEKQRQSASYRLAFHFQSKLEQQINNQQRDGRDENDEEETENEAQFCK